MFQRPSHARKGKQFFDKTGDGEGEGAEEPKKTKPKKRKPDPNSDGTEKKPPKKVKK